MLNWWKNLQLKLRIYVSAPLRIDVFHHGCGTTNTRQSIFWSKVYRCWKRWKDLGDIFKQVNHKGFLFRDWHFESIGDHKIYYFTFLVYCLISYAIGYYICQPLSQWIFPSERLGVLSNIVNYILICNGALSSLYKVYDCLLSFYVP